MKNFILFSMTLLMFFGCGMQNSKDGMTSEMNSLPSNKGAAIIESLQPSETTSAEPHNEAKEYAEYTEYLRQLLIDEQIETSDIYSRNVDFAICDISIKSVQQLNLMDDVASKCVLITCETINKNILSSYLIVEYEGSYMCMYVGASHKSSLPIIYGADLDGDSMDEIVVFYITMGSGRTGPYHETFIYKWKDYSLQTLYYSGDTENPENLINTGFKLTFNDNYKGIMKNDFTKTETVFELPKDQLALYDEKGNFNDQNGYIEANKSHDNAVGNDNNNFLTLKIVDIDSDGVYEIIASEGFFVDIQGSWGIGESYVALKYNKMSSKFEVVKSAFLPFGSDMNSDDFANNWYR